MRILLRNNAVATVALAVIAGLAAAVPIAGWAAARQTHAALPEFLERSDLSDVVAFFCPEEVGDLSDIDLDSEEGYAAQQACFSHDQAAERDAVAAMPEVATALRSAPMVGTADTGNGPEVVLVLAQLDPVLAPPIGSGELIAGRWFDGTSAGDLVVSETIAKLPGWSLGSTALFAPYLMTQADCAGEGTCAAAGETLQVTVVGVVREVADLAATTDDTGSYYLSSAWWDRYGASEPFLYGTGVEVWAAPGVSPLELEDAINARYPGRAFVELSEPEDLATLRDAIGYEARAASLFALFTAIAALMFVGQAIVRQASKEAADLPILISLGAGRRMLVITILLRSALIAAGAAVVTALTAYLLSPLGPVGVARRAEPGTHAFDLPVVLVGLSALVVAVCGLGAIPAWRAFRRTPNRTIEPSPVSAWAAASLPPAAATGVAAALARHQRGRSALTGAIVAMACATAGVVAATTLTASLSSVLRYPEQYGVTWDVAVGNIDSNEGELAAGAAVANIPGISGAVGIHDATAISNGHVVPMMGFVEVAGLNDFDPAIVDGRAPARPGEIALGRNTMAQLGLKIGDEFVFTLDGPNNDQLQATVVGQALLNNTYGLEAGTGALFYADWIVPLIGGQPQQIAVRISPDANRTEVLAALQDAFPNSVVPPTPPTSLRNLVRIDGIPALLAMVIGALALAALAHALVVSIRGRQHELAVLRSLGFTRRQVAASVRWQAITIGVASLTLGIPGGMLLGRWVWRLLSSNIGLSAAPVSELWPLVVVGVGVISVTVLLSVVPGWRALRTRPSVALGDVE